MTYLQHITLHTAHSRRSWRAEISPAAIAACQASLALCLSAPGVRAKLAADMPAHMLAYDLTAEARGRCLEAVVWRGAVARCTIGVAGHSRCAPRLWARLNPPDRLDLRVGPAWPQSPWCAGRLEPGISSDLDAAHWLGDYERCLAWAWLDTLKGAP